MTAKAVLWMHTAEDTVRTFQVEPLLSAYLASFRTNGGLSEETPEWVQFVPYADESLFYVYIDDVLVGYTNRMPVDDVYNSPRLGQGMLIQNKPSEKLIKKVDKNQLFYETYLLAPERGGPIPTTTGLGTATFRVSNDELLEAVKRFAIIDEIEGEFSYIRDQNLHYKVRSHFGFVSEGLLTFRGCKTGEYSRIAQFVVKHDIFREEVTIKPLNDLDLGTRIALGDEALHPQGLRTLINNIAYSFK